MYLPFNCTGDFATERSSLSLIAINALRELASRLPPKRKNVIWRATVHEEKSMHFVQILIHLQLSVGVVHSKRVSAS